MTLDFTPRTAFGDGPTHGLASVLVPSLSLAPALALSVVFALALASSPSARAETSPYYIGASQEFSHNSNLFRVGESQASRSDTISSTALLAGIDQPFGRQRLRLDGTLQTNRFSNNPDLNNIGYGLNAALDWATINRLSGTVSYFANQNLANYGTPNTLQITSRNIQKTQQFLAQAVLGGVTILSFTGGYSHRTVDYSAPAYDAQQFEQDSGNLGLRYRFSGALDVGASLRMTRGRFPHFQAGAGGGFEADTLDRRDFDLTSNWTPTGATSLSARVSFGRQTHSVSSQRDFSGVTGSLSIDHNPGGKLRFAALLSRDTGVENSFLTLFDINGAPTRVVADNSRLSTVAQLSANYEATAKIQLNATLRVSQRSLVDTLTLSNGGAATGNTGSDTVSSVAFGASYAPLRNLSLACNAAREDRRTSSALSSTYGVNSVGCLAKYLLR